jgi:hypothetical protein
MSMKIQKLTNPKKDFIAEMFIILAKLDFRVKFLEWFVQNKVASDKDEKISGILKSIDLA